MTSRRLSGILPIPIFPEASLTANRDDLTAWLRLTLVPGIAPRAQQELLRAFGTPHDLLRASVGDVRRIVGEEVATAFAKGASRVLVERTCAWLEGDGRHLIALGDADYPAQLMEIDDAPTVFYALGDVAVLRRPAIAVVGSRNATTQGICDAEEFSRALSKAGLTIVSGLAHGIDAAAHRGGLAERGSTVAVMGTGPDRVYPRANHALALEIARKGCLISEFPLGMGPVAGNFPRRNRLISGLARAVLVVQAAEESGSLITARLAAQQGRDVFAIPGSIHSPLSKGCHRLIREGAKLVDDVDHVLEELGFAPARLKRAAAPSHPMLRAMGFDPLTIDEIIARTGQAAPTVAAQLCGLEIDGLVQSLPGGRFQQVGRMNLVPSD